MKTRGGLYGKKQGLQAGHIEAWRQSGLSALEYCRQHKLRPNIFAGWLTNEQEKDMAYPVSLVPVPDTICRSSWVRGRKSESTGLCLVVGQHCRIEIDRQFDAGTFARLVTVLEDM